MILAYFLKLTLIVGSLEPITYHRSMPDAETCVRQAQLQTYNDVGENQVAECVVLEVVENLDAEGEL